MDKSLKAIFQHAIDDFRHKYKNNGELDDKKFIEEYELDGYKCEYK